jgi:hypothetical protein
MSDKGGFEPGVVKLSPGWVSVSVVEERVEPELEKSSSVLLPGLDSGKGVVEDVVIPTMLKAPLDPFWGISPTTTDKMVSKILSALSNKVKFKEYYYSPAASTATVTMAARRKAPKNQQTYFLHCVDFLLSFVT